MNYKLITTIIAAVVSTVVFVSTKQFSVRAFAYIGTISLSTYGATLAYEFLLWKVRPFTLFNSVKNFAGQWVEQVKLESGQTIDELPYIPLVNVKISQTFSKIKIKITTDSFTTRQLIGVSTKETHTTYLTFVYESMRLKKSFEEYSEHKATMRVQLLDDRLVGWLFDTRGMYRKVILLKRPE